MHFLVRLRLCVLHPLANRLTAPLRDAPPRDPADCASALWAAVTLLPRATAHGREGQQGRT